MGCPLATAPGRSVMENAPNVEICIQCIPNEKYPMYSIMKTHLPCILKPTLTHDPYVVYPLKSRQIAHIPHIPYKSMKYTYSYNTNPS